MQKLKTQKGITLIALIITIIVMLILVGVSVTVALNGGLFSTAKDAAEGTKVEGEKERLLSIALGALDNKGIVDTDKLDTALEGTDFTGENGTYTSGKTGIKYFVGQRGSVTASEYKIGQEITLEGETFYVIGETAGEVTLLAKNNISTTDLKQANGTNITANAIAFSSEWYWEGHPTASGPIDLNEYSICPEGSAIDIAKQYAEEITGSRDNGRLMTLEELEALGGKNYSTADCPEFINSSFYWLGTAFSYDAGFEYGVKGPEHSIMSPGCGTTGVYGVRPVIEISKSSI